MKVSTEIDNNFGYEKITQLVDNIPLRPSVIVDNYLFASDGKIIHIFFSINEIEKIDSSKPIK